MQKFNVGDKVRLTGAMWNDRLADTIQTVEYLIGEDGAFYETEEDREYDDPWYAMPGDPDWDAEKVEEN